jgi:hypothetical protein
MERKKNNIPIWSTAVKYPVLWKQHITHQK